MTFKDGFKLGLGIMAANAVVGLAMHLLAMLMFGR